MLMDNDAYGDVMRKLTEYPEQDVRISLVLLQNAMAEDREAHIVIPNLLLQYMYGLTPVEEDK